MSLSVQDVVQYATCIVQMKQAYRVHFVVKSAHQNPHDEGGDEPIVHTPCDEVILRVSRFKVLQDHTHRLPERDARDQEDVSKSERRA